MSPFVGSKVKLFAKSGKVGKLCSKYPNTFFLVERNMGAFIKIKVPRDGEGEYGTTLKAPAACVNGIKGYMSVFKPLKEKM